MLTEQFTEHDEEEVIFPAALCIFDDEPIVRGPDGWESHAPGDGPEHTAAPKPGTVAPADVWDFDDAIAGRLGAAEFATVPLAQRTVDYVRAAVAALARGERPHRVVADCPECGQAGDLEDDEHVVIYTDELGYVVLIGCEGYWVIDPNAVGISSPNWQP